MRKPERKNGVWLYTCDRCGKTSVWTSTWAWFGNYLDFEEGNHHKIFMSCSEACRKLSRREIHSVTRGLAKCGPADLMERLRDAHSYKDEVAQKHEIITRMDRQVAGVCRIASIALNVPGKDPREALREIRKQLMTSMEIELEGIS